MDFGLSVEADIELQDKTMFVHQFSEELNAHFASKSFGSDLKGLTIGVILTSPKFEHFFKVRKPKYYDGKKAITYDGITVELEDALEYDIKPDYFSIKEADEIGIRKTLAGEILQSLGKIDTVKKIKDFDREGFKEDLESFFKEQNLI